MNGVDGARVSRACLGVSRALLAFLETCSTSRGMHMVHEECVDEVHGEEDEVPGEVPANGRRTRQK